MATKKLQDLAESTSPNDTDIFIIEDTTATKKITLLNLFNKMISKLGLGSLATKNKVLQSDLDTALANLLAGKLTSSGIANNLSTTDATKVLAAPQGKELLGYIGTLSGLTTAQKTNLVVAVNELVERTDELHRNINNMAFKDFSVWGNLSPGELNTTTRRFSNSSVSTAREFVFVLYQGGNGNESIYEYVHISTPFGELADGYYVSNSISGQLKIYYSKSGKLIDVYSLPATLKQICYR